MENHCTDNLLELDIIKGTEMQILKKYTQFKDRHESRRQISPSFSRTSTYFSKLETNQVF